MRMRGTAMLERNVEDYLIARVTAAGGMTRKVRWLDRRGAPDRRIWLPGCVCFVEAKRPGHGGELRRHQITEHALMRRYGDDVRVINSFLGVDALIEEAETNVRRRLAQ